MKNKLNFRYIFLLLVCIFIQSTISNNLYAQNSKKNKVRIGVDYVKIMEGELYFDIKATSRIDKKTRGVENIDLSVYNVVADESFLLGNTTTNMNGKNRFIVENINGIKKDSTDTYEIKVSFKGNDSFAKASKSIQFKNADITGRIETLNNINYINATLINTSTNSPVVDESLTIKVERLIKSLPIGEEFNNTDENGTILVPIEEGIPGVDGNLIIEVVLNESDEFGTVIARLKAPIGVPIVEDTTFDERTMWSPRNKTPLFLLIFPNLFILVIWGIIIYLIINLFKINKS